MVKAGWGCVVDGWTVVAVAAELLAGPGALPGPLEADKPLSLGVVQFKLETAKPSELGHVKPHKFIQFMMLGGGISCSGDVYSVRIRGSPSKLCTSCTKLARPRGLPYESNMV